MTKTLEAILKDKKRNEWTYHQIFSKTMCVLGMIYMVLCLVPFELVRFRVQIELLRVIRNEASLEREYRTKIGSGRLEIALH